MMPKATSSQAKGKGKAATVASTASNGDQYVPYKYVVYNWRNSPEIRKDPLAQKFFKALQTPTTLFTLLGTPLSLHQAKPNGKPAELYFTSGQADTLKAALAVDMGLTRANQSFKSDVAVTRAKLQDVEEFAVSSESELSARVAKLTAAAEVTATLQNFNELERMRAVYKAAAIGSKPAKFIALDIETWEQDHDLVTEVGWSFVSWDEHGTRTQIDEHIVVAENARRRNGRYCPDARDHYDFGKTRTIPEDALVATLTSLFAPSTTPIFAIFHDHRSDIVSLNLLGIPTSTFTHGLPSTNSSPEGTIITDTQKLFTGLIREKKQAKLETCCVRLGIKTRRLHNAGNDARYTMDVFEAMMNEDVVIMEAEVAQGPKKGVYGKPFR